MRIILDQKDDKVKNVHFCTNKNKDEIFIYINIDRSFLLLFREFKIGQRYRILICVVNSNELYNIKRPLRTIAQENERANPKESSKVIKKGHNSFEFQ